jgi:transposase
MGKTSIRCSERKTWHDTPSFVFVFDQKDCSPCSFRERCSRAKHSGRTLTLYPQEKYEAQLEARKRQQTEAFKNLYAQRAGVESTISQGVRRTRLRHTRYIGLARTHLQQVASAAAINLARVFDWLIGERPKEAWVSPFQALATQI